MNAPRQDAAVVRESTRCWLERAVVGLGLCPFAGAVYRAGLVHIEVCDAVLPAAILSALGRAAQDLLALDPARRETTLLVLPRAFPEFRRFNDFLDEADRLLAARQWEGVLQVASFHPRYRFAGSPPDSPGNRTNRSPYPTLHLLREASVSAATATWTDGGAGLTARNIQVLEDLGDGGWEALWRPPGGNPP